MSEKATSTVDAFADGFWDAILELNPTTATVYGDDRFDDRLEDPGPEGRAKARALFERTLDEARSIATDGLSVEDRITVDLVRVICQLAIEQDNQRFDRIRVLDQIQGPQTLLPQIVLFQPADNPERLEKLLARLAAYKGYMAANTELLREAAASGMTQPQIVIERTIAQLEGLLAIPSAESPIVAGARVAGDADRERVREVVERVVQPADRAYLDVLRNVYRPAARSADGLWSVPNGDELYRTQVLAWTTLKLDPNELHQYGRDQLDLIEAERQRIARENGFGGDSRAYRAALAADPTNIPESREELVRRATEDIERAMAVAPRAFGRLPKASCEVREVETFKEKDSPFAYYYPPSADGSRPGIYYVNAYDLPSRTYTTLGTTTYHEAVPGHHFQIALEQENANLSTFRRFGSRIVGSSFVEGWGLYSERLADELGLFRNEGERFGMLDAQAWRAGRLVVDTGIHFLHWSRQQSIDFLRDVGLTDTNATIETDRYITWPAQALSYMVGQREIERLRREIAARDGSRFDLRAFHDAVLGHGSLPLATLARELPGWVAMPV